MTRVAEDPTIDNWRGFAFQFATDGDPVCPPDSKLKISNLFRAFEHHERDSGNYGDFLPILNPVEIREQSLFGCAYLSGF